MNMDMHMSMNTNVNWNRNSAMNMNMKMNMNRNCQTSEEYKIHILKPMQLTILKTLEGLSLNYALHILPISDSLDSPFNIIRTHLVLIPNQTRLLRQWTRG